MAKPAANLRPADEAASPPPRKLVTFTRVDQIEHKPLRPLVDGYLYADTLASVVGKSGSCKSFLAQGLCASVATGTPWMGQRVDQGAVFYLGGEGLAGIKKRFEGWSRFTGISLEGAPLYIASGLPSLCDQLNTAAIVGEVSEVAERIFYESGAYEPKLFVVDTFARAMAGGDENSAADVGRIIDGLDWIRSTWNCCVMVIHHTGYGENSKERGRGSSAYYAALDSELLVTSDGGRVTVRSMKEKDWPKPPELSLDRHVVEVPIESVTETTLVLDLASGIDKHEQALVLRREIQQLRTGGKSVRVIAAELGLTKSKVEHELGVMKRQADEYRQVSGGV